MKQLSHVIGLICVAAVSVTTAAGCGDSTAAPPPGSGTGGAGGTGGQAPGTGGQAPGTGGQGPSTGGKSAALYPEDRIIDLHLTFPPGAWERLLVTPEEGQGEQGDRWQHCSLAFEGQTFAQASCRRKGNSSYWPEEKKPQLVVRFNWIDRNGRFFGLRRLNLESFHKHPAPVRDRLGMWLQRAAGVDAPRVGHARVWKDGALLGLYMNIEAVDKEFLEAHFPGQAGGNLWESAVELKTNEDVNDQQRLVALEELVDGEPLAGDHSAFFSRLDALVDIEQVLREMAAETAALADDNFSNGGANYYLYDHPVRGFLVLPWDFDTMFVAEADADPFTFWDGAPPNRWRQLMDQNPAWRAQYVDTLAQIRDQVLPRLPGEVDRVCAQIRAAFLEDPNRYGTAAEFDDDCRAIKQKAPARIAALKRMLGR
jgi:hypothetical protein